MRRSRREPKFTAITIQVKLEDVGTLSSSDGLSWQLEVGAPRN